MSHEGDKYRNKLILDLDDGWSYDGIMEKIESLGFIFKGGTPTRENFDKQCDKGQMHMILYSSKSLDSEEQVRYTIVRTLELKWYYDREWTRVEMGKMEIPY